MTNSCKASEFGRLVRSAQEELPWGATADVVREFVSLKEHGILGYDRNPACAARKSIIRQSVLRPNRDLPLSRLLPSRITMPATRVDFGQPPLATDDAQGPAPGATEKGADLLQGPGLMLGVANKASPNRSVAIRILAERPCKTLAALPSAANSSINSPSKKNKRPLCEIDVKQLPSVSGGVHGP